MNSQYPFPNPPFSFTPLNPNPNPNPNFSIPHSQPYPQNQSPFSNLPTSQLSLKTLLQSSISALDSISPFLNPNLTPPISLIQCQSNPNHWVPPCNLFQHSLNCPSPINVGPIIDSLKYPKTIDSNFGGDFVVPIDDHNLEVCFSIDEFVSFESDFFYDGCHGVVSSVSDDGIKRVFSIPRVLSIECSNFVGNVDVEIGNFSGFSGRMLPSEMWVVGKEFEMWVDFPSEYSYSVVKCLLCLKCVKESDLSMWVIENSPRFGVVIDVAMRDHMCVLFRVCLKAIVREAKQCYENLVKNNEGGSFRKLDVKSLRFKCPVLVEGLRWLALQLSILYGEMNAKSFVIEMLRHLLRNAVSIALLIPLDRKLEQREIVEDKEDDRIDARIFSKSIFVKQIAASVGALHERALLEERIRALRNPPPLTTYQRMVEHQHFSNKADEERQKRPDYRPLIEHDSLPSQQKNDQETDRLKTREELLAEERDYKRRRMSYRGKKHKRSAKEVMRDIIEEYMEAIEQTGGIGLTNEDAEAMSTSKKASTEKSMNFETNHDLENDRHDGYRTLMDSGYNSMDKKPDPFTCRKAQHKSESYYHRDYDDRTQNGDRYSRDYRSRSPSRDRRHTQSKEHRSHRRNEHNVEMDGNEGSRRNYSSSSSYRSSSGRRDKRKLESSERGRSNKHENDERGSCGRIEFSDRYDPSEDDSFIES